VAGIKSVLGNTAPDLSPKATDGQAIRSQVIKVSERFGGRLNKTSLARQWLSFRLCQRWPNGSTQLLTLNGWQ
jgi:hypothetical protein